MFFNPIFYSSKHYICSETTLSGPRLPGLDRSRPLSPAGLLRTAAHPSSGEQVLPHTPDGGFVFQNRLTRRGVGGFLTMHTHRATAKCPCGWRTPLPVCHMF